METFSVESLMAMTSLTGLTEELDLEALHHLTSKSSKFRRKNSLMIYLRGVNEELVRVFRSGRLVVFGVKTLTEARVRLRACARLIQKTDSRYTNIGVRQTTVRSLTCKLDCGFKVSLTRFLEGDDGASHNPEIDLPGVRYNYDIGRSLTFSSGAIMIKAESLEKARRVAELAYQKAARYKQITDHGDHKNGEKVEEVQEAQDFNKNVIYDEEDEDEGNDVVAGQRETSDEVDTSSVASAISSASATTSAVNAARQFRHLRQ